MARPSWASLREALGWTHPACHHPASQHHGRHLLAEFLVEDDIFDCQKFDLTLASKYYLKAQRGL